MPRTLPPLDHVVTMTDDVGMIQHAFESVPNRSTGYCTDDISRAFIVALQKLRLDPRDVHAARIASTYLSFLFDAQLECGRFHNFMSYERGWLDDIGTHDSVGRALWSLGYAVRYAPTAQWRRVCRAMIDRSLQSIDWLEFTRAQCYTMLGLSHAVLADASPGSRTALRALAERLESRYLDTHGEDWEWFEDVMTYDNARLPEAMLRAGMALEEPRFIDIGLRTLAFYESVVIENGVFVPIGNDGWYRRGGERARFAQQPLEATALVDAELAAFAATGAQAHLGAAETGLAWFYGKNLCGVTMAQGGGCFDGLAEHSVNRNMGAESTLAHLSAAYGLAEHRSTVLRVAR